MEKIIYSIFVILIHLVNNKKLHYLLFHTSASKPPDRKCYLLYTCEFGIILVVRTSMYFQSNLISWKNRQRETANLSRTLIRFNLKYHNYFCCLWTFPSNQNLIYLLYKRKRIKTKEIVRVATDTRSMANETFADRVFR